MKKSIVSLAAAALLACNAAHSSVLFENGTLNDFSSGNNPFTYSVVTDDFALTSASTLQSLTFNAFTTQATVPITNVLVNFLDAGMNSLFSGNFQVASSATTGSLFGYNLTNFTVNLPNVSLASGYYFLGLQVSPQQWDMHWSIPNTDFGTAGSDGFGHYFKLEGSLGAVSPVPEPEGLAMLAAGIGLVGFLLRRRGAGLS